MNRNVSTGPGAHTPDGCAVDLYRRLPDEGEAAIIHAAVPSHCEILELGAGAGRVTRVLTALGHPVTAVDYSDEMLAHVDNATKVCADIAGLALGRTFACVVLGSYLVNVVEIELRTAFLETCRRHVAGDGTILIECHPPAVLERARPGLIGRDGHGFSYSWLEVSTHGGLVSGTVETRHGNDRWTQTFSAEVLNEARLRADLAGCGLRLVRYLDARWIVAARTSRSRPRRSTRRRKPR